MQAQRHHVATYVSGCVIGTAPLCIAVMSPLIGYFVSTTAAVSYVLSSSKLHPKVQYFKSFRVERSYCIRSNCNWSMCLRKVCPQCNTIVHVKRSVCDCGHALIRMDLKCHAHLCCVVAIKTSLLSISYSIPTCASL